MCVNPTSIKQENGSYILVPCGKCIECMKDKQNETAVLCVREAERRGSFEFVTLTYSNDTIPFYSTLCLFDEETGEISYSEDPLRVGDPEYEQYLRETYFKDHKDCFESIYESVGDFTFCCTPSLCRKDIQDWIKRSRRSYEYHHKGEKLDFGYICCGEYGTHTGRPHWHLGIFGLSHEQVLEMCKDWNDKYGFSVVSKVEPFDPKNASRSPWEAAAKYVGKYIAKPREFEHKGVYDHRVEKPRRQTSIGFGDRDDLQQLKSYHYCYDMVGEYDPDDPTTFPSMDEKQFIELLEEIIKRKKYRLNGKDYKLPRRITRKLFYKQIKEKDPSTGEVKRKERSLYIQSLVGMHVRNYFNKNFTAELRALRSQFGDEIPFEEIRRVVHSENIARQDRAKTTFKTMLNKTYQKSYF